LKFHSYLVQGLKSKMFSPTDLQVSSQQVHGRVSEKSARKTNAVEKTQGRVATTPYLGSPKAKNKGSKISKFDHIAKQ